MDETLVHTTGQKLDYEESFRFAGYYVYKRPGVDLFIGEMRKIFDLAVWTSAGEVSAEYITSHLFYKDELKFTWASRRCTLSRNFHTGEYDIIKNIRKIKKKGYDLKNVIMVDDTASKHRRNYGNLVLVSEFVGNPSDTELAALTNFLKVLSSVPNVRSIEKRSWIEYSGEKSNN